MITTMAKAGIASTALSRWKIGQALVAPLRVFLCWNERWLQRCALSELDGHVLRDIGISPREVKRECAKPFWRR